MRLLPPLALAPPRPLLHSARMISASRTSAVTLILAIVGASCAPVPPVVRSTPGWTHVDFHVRRSRCTTKQCRLTLKGSDADVQATQRLDSYRPHEIPGWHSPLAGRVADAILQGAIRRAGGFSERTRIELGSYLVVDLGDTTSQMRCSTLAISDDQVERRNDADEVTTSRRRTTGWNCRIEGSSELQRTVWQFRAGIAPTRDSLAAIYDSLAAIESREIQASPPLHLEQSASDGGPVRFPAAWDPRMIVDPLWVASRLTITRDGGRAVAVVDLGTRTRLHLAPDVSAEERRVLRLVAVFLTVSP